MDRVTAWRHKTGRSKNRYPKGLVNYRAVAISIAKKRFLHLWSAYQADTIQECQLLQLEAKKKKRIHVWVGSKRRAFGNCRDRIGIKCFSRAVHARLHEMSKRYGYYRPKGSSCYYPRKAWDWGLKEDWLFEMPVFEEPDFVFFQIKKAIPVEILEKALTGDKNAIAQCRAIIWDA